MATIGKGYAPGQSYKGPMQLVMGPNGVPVPLTATNAPVGAPGGGTVTLPDSAYTRIITPDINQFVPNYGGLSTSSSRNINSLLNPTDFSDVQRRAAEHAVAGGFAGSGLASSEGTRLTEEERIRRMLLGEQALSGAVGRVQRPLVLPGMQQNYAPPSYAAPNTFSPGGNGGVVPGGFSLGSGRPPVTSPGNAANPVLPGRATPQSNNWLQNIIGSYSPETPLHQMRSGVGQQFQSDQNPDITGPEGWMGSNFYDPQYGEDPNYQPVYTGEDDWSWLDNPDYGF